MSVNISGKAHQTIMEICNWIRKKIKRRCEPGRSNQYCANGKSFGRSDIRQSYEILIYRTWK